MISKFLRHLCANVFYTICLLFGLLAVIHAQQTGEKLVKVNQAVQITDAVMISNVAVAGKPIECGLFIKAPGIHPAVPFQAGSNWLQQMTISLVNRTNKTIVFGAILLHFLDTGDCKATPCVGTDLHFGQRPLVDSYNGRTGQLIKPELFERPPIEWKPEQTFVVHVSDYIDEMESNLSHAPRPLTVTDITKLNVYLGVFYFSDGMQWNLGRFSVPDPEHPGKFKELPADYFPGKRDYNWPPEQNQ